MPKRRPAEQEAQPEPHDALIKWTFSQKEHAAGLLRAALPPAAVKAVDFDTLDVEKDSFIDEALRKSHSDLVFSAQIGDERTYFYALIEHQRVVEPLMLFRVLRYMVRLWERVLQEAPERKTLPMVVPLLIHHSETGWTAATAFQDILEGRGAARASLMPHVPRFKVRLIDLSEGRASRLVDDAMTALGQVVLWSLSVAGNDERLEREIGRMRDLLAEVLTAPNALAALRVLMRYLLATHTRMPATKVSSLLKKATGSRAQETFVDLFDEFKIEGRREGRREGKREGRLEGKREGKREALEQVLLTQLSARFGTLSAEVKTRIKAAGDEELSAWTLRVLTAPTLEEVLASSGASARSPARRAAPRARPRR